MKNLFVLLLSGTFLWGDAPATAQSKSSATILTIPFGAQNKIVYQLKQGTYSLVLDGKETMQDAYALCKGDHIYDSRAAATRSYTQTPVHTPAGKGMLYTITSEGTYGQLQQLFYVFPGKNYCITELKVKEASCYYMSPLTATHFSVRGKGDHRVLSVPFDNDMWLRYDAREMAKATFASSEVTALYNNDTYKGIVIGSLEHDVWKSGVQVQAGNDTALSSLSVFAGYTNSLITHDQLTHGAVLPVNGYCHSPKIVIGRFNDWRDGMETYASLNMLFGPRYIFSWTKPTPIGWNSWGAIQEKITYDKAKAVVDFFYDSCKTFRTADNSLFIDLDSFWDNMAEGGIDGNLTKLKAFAAYCKQKGFKPGIYWAPFTDWGKYNRKMEGSNYQYQQTWTLQKGKNVDTDGGRAMDPTHPGTRNRVIHYLTRLKEMGYQMIKIDFLSHGAIEGDHFYDPAVTTGMQAFRKGMELVDSVLDGSMLVYAAISPNLATARYVHMRRIGCDAFSAIDNTEYTLNSTGYGWWQGTMYNYIDADHVVFTNAPDNMNRARLASAVITGTLITGDDYSANGKWKATAQKLLQNKSILAITRKGKSFRPVDANTGNKGVNVFTQIIEGICYAAVFNFNSQDQELTIPLNRLGLNDKGVQWQATELFTSTTLQLHDSLHLKVPASDALIYKFIKLQ
jgi:alpha-galactosidase